MKVNEAGDAILAEFESITEVVDAAMEFQAAMKERSHSESDDQQLQFRIGINLGEVIHDRCDIFGDGVNVAARVQAMAEPGGVCTTATVYEQVNGRVSFKFVDL